MRVRVFRVENPIDQGENALLSANNVAHFMLY